jgi:GntR family transcriptional regulator, negative regulator for fad regulon and positive regulator of fabA
MKEHLVMKRRSSDQIEKKVIDAILDGDYPIGSYLPSERELAKAYGVGRPTVREALQRLGRDGWLDIRHGQSTRVKNYWNEGNLTTLVNIIQNLKVVPDEFVIHLLELRSALVPAYSRDAVMAHQAKVVALLADTDQLEDTQDAFARFDWELQQGLARLSDNPVYLLILNSFNPFYLDMAKIYFESPTHRLASKDFYERFLSLALKGDSKEVEELVNEVMENSITLWRSK